MAASIRSISNAVFRFSAISRPSVFCIVSRKSPIPPRLPSNSQVARFVSYRTIKETTAGNVTTVEGVYVEDKSNVLPDENPHASCPLCKLNRMITYRDVLIIQQFLRPDGGKLPSRITGLCRMQQRHLEKVAQQTLRAGLLPDHRPRRPEGHIPRRKPKFNRF
ncbi:large ribosomal subunit protein mL66-like [Saccoglossus kowalevskii]|uniref:28S ribosomal protein S18a, mitochondrial-like n=1 Tax=Saccoglossus kowalevskii TaxID=10224 RepID=A0ABM0MUQ5_SACKO|nr:PREDICTED: 28S ribosomal protein S18a, mitochondrial-like [Saccoglossus kowalevskii]